MARPRRATTKSKPHPKSNPKSKAKDKTKPLGLPGEGDTASGKPTHRITDTHVFFFGGPLSNFHQGATFPGQRCLDLLLPQLARLQPPVQYPAATAFATRLLGSFPFSCGEQWMMALKGWVFEQNLALAGREVGDEEFQSLRAAMLNRAPPTEEEEELQDMWQGTLCGVLRAGKPRVCKSLGRKASGFDEDVWRVVSPLVVMAACVARAERDPILKRIYLDNPTKAFVEGSPFDQVWGVGLHWTNGHIDNPANWKGENRLGTCHDLAAQKIREAFSENVLKNDA